MSLDLVIRNGTVLDGTGAEPISADLVRVSDTGTDTGTRPNEAGT